MPSSSLVAVATARETAVRGDFSRRESAAPTSAWRLDLEDPLIAASADPHAPGFAPSARQPRRGIHRRLLPGGLDLDLKGDYGRTPYAMRGGVRIVDDSKLLRWSAMVRSGGWRLGGSFGNKAHPVRPGERLSWIALARYDRGPVSLGLVYSYTLDTQADDGEREDVFGSVQGGISYAITDRVTASLNAAYWDTMTAEGPGGKRTGRDGRIFLAFLISRCLF